MMFLMLRMVRIIIYAISQVDLQATSVYAYHQISVFGLSTFDSVLLCTAPRSLFIVVSWQIHHSDIGRSKTVTEQMRF
jgi:hypothetical protein